MVKVVINNKIMKMQIDTGADVNVINAEQCEKIGMTQSITNTN